jgi:hypothetical protein
MNQLQLLSYMKSHDLMARIGTPESLASAKMLEQRGMVKHIGDDDEGKPIYRITREGQAKLGMVESVKKISTVKTGGLELPKGIE